MASRPGLDELLAFVRTVDTITIQALGRLGHSTKNLLNPIDYLRDRGIALQIPNQGVDTGTPAGQMLLVLVAPIAEMEKEALRARTLDGLAAAHAQFDAFRGNPARPRRPRKPTDRPQIAHSSHHLRSAGGLMPNTASVHGAGWTPRSTAASAAQQLSTSTVRGLDSAAGPATTVKRGPARRRPQKNRSPQR